ncbi:Transglutaminase-like superfamily protein [Porphyromonadaceae bacterium NLAE-zl-C104]|nr:Transglutaminase-like superfamily protein [Porphyromonadaceae bacterium NLAE-zl-C104]
MIISNQQSTYTYMMENNRVIVKENQDVIYTCIKNVQPVPFFRFYDSNSEITKIRVKGVKASSPKYETYTKENIFYDDSKVCYFTLQFKDKSEVGTVTYEKKYKDVYGFSFINIVEPYFIRSKVIRIIVPQWMEIDIVENNFDSRVSRSKTVDPKSGNTIYIYQIENQEAYRHEDFMPDYMLTFPSIQIVPRKAVINKKIEEYFYSFDHMYRWCKSKADMAYNDHDAVAQLAKEITKESETDRDKINALLNWVQNNIRYIAFEYGIQGFKPDDAQAVMRKKYGDCKGMSNLLKCLLLAEGFDARLVWINTTDAGREWTLPIPSADHMICALNYNNEFHFLDPTVKFMPFGEIAYTIQGKMAMVEDGDHYLMLRTPSFPPSHNRTQLMSQYVIEGGKLKGESELSFHGEPKYGITFAIRYTGKTDADIYLKNFLKSSNQADSIFELEIKGIEIGSKSLSISYEELRPSSVRPFSDELYIDPDVFKDFAGFTIDTLKRKNDYAFPFSQTIRSHIRIVIPEGYSVKDIPQDMEIETDDYHFNICYSVEDQTILYQKEITIKNTTLPKSNFFQWNRNIGLLKNAYAKQITLEKILN